METAIPRFAERISPLRTILEAAHTRTGGSRKKPAIASTFLDDVVWTDEPGQLFHTVQRELIDTTKLAHRDTSLPLYIFTDASDNFWTTAVTQCSQSD